MNHYDLDGALVRWSGRWSDEPSIYRERTDTWEPYPYAERVFAEGTPLTETQLRIRLASPVSVR